jgi:hypothetical protein
MRWHPQSLLQLSNGYSVGLIVMTGFGDPVTLVGQFGSD